MRKARFVDALAVFAVDTGDDRGHVFGGDAVELRCEHMTSG
jgi:hypothetical protein